ncbi:hypothetical protein COI99_30110 [Bacillus cereus]|nr:hypothetical protein COI99_30110 [Bacillus cereus]
MASHKYSKFKHWFSEHPNENEFRKKVLVPLLKKMGYLNVRDNHGPHEFGKDIVCIAEQTSPSLGEIFIAVVAKKGDVNNTIASQIQTQIVNCFGTPYSDPLSGKKVSIDKVLVITDGAYVGTSKDSLVNVLELYANKNKEIEFWDGDNLEGNCEKFLKYSSGVIDSSNLVYMHYAESAITRIFVNPKKDEGLGGREIIQGDENFYIIVVYNDDETIKEIELIDIRKQVNENELEPNEILAYLNNVDESDESDEEN